MDDDTLRQRVLAQLATGEKDAHGGVLVDMLPTCLGERLRLRQMFAPTHVIVDEPERDGWRFYRKEIVEAEGPEGSGGLRVTRAGPPRGPRPLRQAFEEALQTWRDARCPNLPDPSELPSVTFLAISMTPDGVGQCFGSGAISKERLMAAAEMLVKMAGAVERENLIQRATDAGQDEDDESKGGPASPAIN